MKCSSMNCGLEWSTPSIGAEYYQNCPYCGSPGIDYAAIRAAARPVVFFDLDGTLINTVYYTVVAAGGVWNGITTYGMKELPPDVLTRVFELFKSEEWTCRAIPPLEGAAQCVREVAALGCRVLGLTVRPFEDATKEYCKKYFPEMEDVIFIGSASKEMEDTVEGNRKFKTKVEVIENTKGAIAFIDDCPKYLWEMLTQTELPLVVATKNDYNEYTELDWTCAGSSYPLTRIQQKTYHSDRLMGDRLKTATLDNTPTLIANCMKGLV